MGLDCSHDAWHGSYGSFMVWRKKLAEAAGLPPLELMEGFYVSITANSHYAPSTLYYGPTTNTPAFGQDSQPYLVNIDERLPIRWDCLAPSPLYKLLHHSDCDGEISADDCGPIADALEKLIPLLPDDDRGWRERTQQFVTGLRLAASLNEALDFH